jgi:ribosomal-protein-alanine N-acetyltransferase
VQVGHQLELATSADANAIARLSRAEVEQGFTWSWTPSRVRRAIEDRKTNVVVARRGGALIGFAITEYHDDDAHLGLLAVSADHRRGRVGTALLGWLAETFAVAGIRSMRAEVREKNAAARAFYATAGFIEVGRTAGYYQGIEGAVHLIKGYRPWDRPA